MTSFGLINLGVLPLLLEAMAPAYAQHDPREQEQRRPQHEQEARPERTQQEGRPERQPERQEPPRRQEEGRPARQQPQPAGPPNREEPRHTQEPTPNRRPVPSPRPEESARARAPQEPQRHPQGQPQGQPQAREPVRQARREYESQHRGAWQDRRAHNWQAEHRNWIDRGGYNGYRIPDGNFRGHFGPSHRFRMSSFPIMVVGGFPRFQYGGFWFSVMDPWPEYWSDNWYGSDDLYIEYFGGGYYLRNRMHPMDRIAVTVFVG